MYRILYLLLIIYSSNTFAQTHLKLMSYNLMNYTNGNNTTRKDDLRNILNNYQPDLFMACEITDENSSDEVLNYCLGTQNYQAVSFYENHSGSYRLQQMLYFNKYKFELTQETSITTLVRDINHYTLKLKTTQAQTNPVYLDIYVAHLKASQGSQNENTRLIMVQDFTNDLQNIPQGHFVIFAGDLNLYSSFEPAYQELLDPTNSVVLNDPINSSGTWHNNFNFRQIHTQSTHANTSTDFVGGGLDDRFDFILLSENMFTGNTLRYVPGSYKSFGNNGNCYNKSVNDTSCTGTYDMTLRNHLYNMSDHLPVVAELSTNQTLSVMPQWTNQNMYFINEGNRISQSLSIRAPKNAVLNLKIFDISGQIIYQNKAYVPNEDIVVNHLSNGIYIIHIQDNNQQQVLKFVKTD